MPDLDRHGQGHRRRTAAVGGDRPRRDHGRPPRRRAGRHLRRQPARLRRRARRDRDHRGRTASSSGPARSARLMLDRLHALQNRDARIGDVRGRGAMIAVELVRPGTGEPDAALPERGRRVRPRQRRDRADLRHLRQRPALPAAAGDPRRPAHRRPRRPAPTHVRGDPTTTCHRTTPCRLRHRRRSDRHAPRPTRAPSSPRRSTLLGYTDGTARRCSRRRAASSPSASRCGATRRDRAAHRPPRAAQLLPRPGQGRPALQPRTSTSTRSARSRCG